MAVQRAAVPPGREDAPARREPRRCISDNSDRILDVLEHMPEHDIVEATPGNEILEETLHYPRRRESGGERHAEGPAAFDNGERLARLCEKLRHHAFRGSHFQNGLSA